jgi:hypothetical protein
MLLALTRCKVEVVFGVIVFPPLGKYVITKVLSSSALKVGASPIFITISPLLGFTFASVIPGADHPLAVHAGVAVGTVATGIFAVKIVPLTAVFLIVTVRVTVTSCCLKLAVRSRV